MPVPWVLGDSGIFPVAALVACEARCSSCPYLFAVSRRRVLANIKKGLDVEIIRCLCNESVSWFWASVGGRAHWVYLCRHSGESQHNCMSFWSRSD